MKKFMLKLLCLFSAVFILINTISAVDFNETSAVEPVGKMSSVYAYILNDYITEYGVLSTDSEGNNVSGNGASVPHGVVYGDLINFNKSAVPYLVIFTVNGERQTASCHIWTYSDETEKAIKIVQLDKNYDLIPDTQNGEFAIAGNDDGNFIAYNKYENNSLIGSEYYTVFNNDAFMYVNNPAGIRSSGVMYFNSPSFNSAVNISNYNEELDKFFSMLKISAAKSVTRENIAEKTNADDMTALSRVLIRASLYWDFDIANYKTDNEYTAALEETTSSDIFTQLTALYDLGDGIYYALFDTTRSVYNYALLRKSDAAKNGYQILKVRTDCIPLSDRELKKIKIDYMQNPLLYEKSKTELELHKKAAEKETASVTVSVGDAPAVTVAPKAKIIHDDGEVKSAAPKNITIDLKGIRFPAACIAGGIAIALLTILWVYLYWD